MDASKLKKYFDDPAVVDARILIDYREEHLLTKKDVLFIKKIRCNHAHTNFRNYLGK